MKLSASVVDEAEDDERMFSRDLLRELFTLMEGTTSNTHDVYKCKRCKGGKQAVKAPAMLYGDQSTSVPPPSSSSWRDAEMLHRWNHYETAELVHLHDDLLRAESNYSDVTACFQYVST